MANTCDSKMDRKVVMIDHRLQVTKGGRQERLLDGSRRGGRTGGPDVAECCSGYLACKLMERRMHRVLTSDFKEAGSEMLLKFRK